MKKLLQNIKERVKERSRLKKDDHFYSLCSKENTILDVGVFPEISEGQNDISTNHFLKGFRFPPKYYTGLSIDSLQGMEKIYPGKTFIQYDGGTFPFHDKEFKWAYSNAVIEHVGNYDSKVHFVREMVRVARNVFFTTPNKYFPVDAHTLVFFIHWNDRLFLKWRENHKIWLPKSSLNLVSIGELKRILKDANVNKYKIVRNRIFGLTMTFTVII